MGGCRCSYKNCANTTKTRDNLHFFHYPVKQKERCKIWIENANKPQFYDLDEDQLRNKVICESHFQDSYFLNAQKKRLLQGAIPTLDGDCVQETALKVQDVQVLPANDDGTIFVLESNNLQRNIQSEKIESYIYTNNGLVLPINKCNDNADSNMLAYTGSEAEEIFEPPIKHRKFETVTLKREVDPVSYNVSSNAQINSLQNLKRTHQSIVKPKVIAIKTNTEAVASKAIEPEPKYLNKIKQHSKEIANIKRLLKQRPPIQKVSNGMILSRLKRQIPPSLYNLVSINLNSNNCVFTTEDLEFYTTMYSTSPELYRTLSEKYKWKLPNMESFLSSKNGQVVDDEEEK